MSEDDVAGICAVYPADREIRESDRTCEPRGKYSTKCEDAGCDCGLARSTQSVTPSHAPWLTTMLLSWLWLRRRSRTTVVTSQAAGTRGQVRRATAGRGFWLLALLFLFAVGCRRKSELHAKPHRVDPKPEQAESPPLTPDDTPPFSAKTEPPPVMPAQAFVDSPFAGLKVHERGTPLSQAKRVVVLFHGYGAPGDDLVSLAEPLFSEGTAFVFPEAPIELTTGGRAWFTRDRSDFEQGYQRALALVQVLTRDYPQLELVIGGFSQGAMLTSNLVADAPAQLVAALVFSPANLLTHVPKPSTGRVVLLVSHGSLDQVLPFSEGEALRDRFLALGYPVTWAPFVGPHTISRDVLAKTRKLLASLGQP